MIPALVLCLLVGLGSNDFVPWVPISGTVASQLDTPGPETLGPETPSPEDTQPETPGPEDTQPETPGPGDTQPETPGPEDTQPETSGPEEFVPDATTLAEDVHMLRLYADFIIQFLLPLCVAIFVIYLFCYWVYRTWFSWF